VVTLLSSIFEALFDYLALQAYQPIVGLYIGGVMFAYLAVKYTEQRRMFRYYALIALILMAVAAWAVTV
jgi:hypothetical protein